jgi:hypothetical protein
VSTYWAVLAADLTALVAIAAAWIAWRLAHRILASERGRAGVRRAVKFLAFALVGALAGNATAIASDLVARVTPDPAVVALASSVAGALAAGVHKSATWQELSSEYGGQQQ